MFGRPEAAAAAKLFIIAAGPQSAIAHCQPLFDAMGQRTFVIGERPSWGQSRQAQRQLPSGRFDDRMPGGGRSRSHEKGESIPTSYLEIMTSTLFSAPAYKTYGALIADQRYRAGGFQHGTGAQGHPVSPWTAAEALAVPMPAASMVHDHFLAGLAQGAGQSDWSALARLCARNAGL